MTIIDARLELSDAQALASVSSGSSSVSTNVIDLGANGTDAWANALTTRLGVGGNLELVAQVNTALVGASAAVIVTLVTKTAADISSGGTTIATLPTFAATAVAGTKYAIRIPTGVTIQRYLGVLYTASGGKLTSAKFDAWIGLGHDDRI